MKANKIRLNGEVLLDLTTDTATPETVAEGVTFHMADGTPATGAMVAEEDLDAELTEQEGLIATLKEKLMSGAGGGSGGAELNIAYGDTPPEDTTKLWVKTSEPSGVVVSTEMEPIETEGESFYTLPITLPRPVCTAGCAVVGSKIYILGGYTKDSTGAVASKSVLVYDTETGTFEDLTDVLGAAIVGICCAVVGTRIYFAGGGATVTTRDTSIRYFDTETKKLVTCTAQLPTSMYGVGCVEKDGMVYIFSGRTQSGFPKEVYSFDPQDETLVTIGSAFTAAYSSRFVRKGSKVHQFGNADDGTIWRVFDLDTLVAEVLGNSSSGLGLTISTSCAYGCFGGDIYTITPGKIYKVNAEDKTYQELPFTPHRNLWYSACATVGNKIYIFGASSSSYNNPIDEVNAYSLTTPVPALPKDSLLVKPSTKDNVFQLVKADGAKVEIGVDSVYKGNAEGIGEEVEAALYKGGEWVTI